MGRLVYAKQAVGRDEQHILTYIAYKNAHIHTYFSYKKKILVVCMYDCMYVCWYMHADYIVSLVSAFHIFLNNFFLVAFNYFYALEHIYIHIYSHKYVCMKMCVCMPLCAHTFLHKLYVSCCCWLMLMFSRANSCSYLRKISAMSASWPSRPYLVLTKRSLFYIYIIRCKYVDMFSQNTASAA